MKLATAFVALAFAAFATSVNAVNTTSGAPVYTASKSFPTGLFPSMYYMPKNMEACHGFCGPGFRGLRDQRQRGEHHVWCACVHGLQVVPDRPVPLDVLHAQEHGAGAASCDHTRQRWCLPRWAHSPLASPLWHAQG